MKPARLILLTTTVIAAAVMELIDTSIVNVALSHMSGNLGALIQFWRFDDRFNMDWPGL